VILSAFLFYPCNKAKAVLVSFALRSAAFSNPQGKLDHPPPHAATTAIQQPIAIMAYSDCDCRQGYYQTSTMDFELRKPFVLPIIAI